ncbi:MAG: hypothetical protein NZM15_09910 [Flavobacteriales bacterium]|nr:hypothetical protein [Flavobacteriales bacterium]MDW8432998.1 hypothetical protein [Flavobacteriales bacterium]
MRTCILSLISWLLALGLAAQTNSKEPPRDPETGKPIVYVAPNQPMPADVLVEEMPVYKIHPDLDPNLTEEERSQRDLQKKIEYYRAQGIDYKTGLPLGKDQNDEKERVTQNDPELRKKLIHEEKMQILRENSTSNSPQK